MDAQRLTAEGASRPLSVPAGSYLDDEGTCFLPAVASSGLRLHSPSRAPGGGAASTSQGHPRTVFKRALERDNLVLAEVTAREIGHVEEHPTATIEEAGVVATCLRALDNATHDEAAQTLRGMVEKNLR